ncbi:MAG: efflux RND transporter permease subunit, partial [Candidatus Eisenbacteria bacterium]|nr:efflux RND transporter permease subunit [Candidatus Eisenbacteria bacterium]
MQTQAFGYQGFIRIEFDDELLASHYPLLYRELLTEQADKTGGSGIFIRGFSAQPYMKGTFGGAGLNSLIKITGYNSKTLMELANDTLARVERNRRVRNARITTSSGFRSSDQEEAVIRLRRDKLAEHDLGVVQVVGHIRRMLGVDTPWRMFVDGEREQIQLIYEDSETIQYGDLADRVILSPSGEKVRIGDLVSIDLERSPGDITRDNQRYSVQVNWEYVGTERMRSSYIKDILAGIQLPYGYTAEESERQFFTPEEEEELTLMVVLAAVFIFMILAALFESISLPILVMLSLPMALVGVVVLFWLTSSDFDSSARIGLVLLFGIVVNNAILLVSRFRHEAESILRLKLGGEPAKSRSLLPGLTKQLGGSDLGIFPPAERVDLLKRAVARGTRIKLRSILLTTGTTLVGLLPLLRFRDETEGRDIWVNLALSSTGGLASSLVLILLMVPVLYTLFVRLGWDARVM